MDRSLDYIEKRFCRVGVKEVPYILDSYYRGSSYKEIAKDYPVSAEDIGDIVRKYREYDTRVPSKVINCRGQIFDSTVEAARELGISSNHIPAVCREIGITQVNTKMELLLNGVTMKSRYLRQASRRIFIPYAEFKIRIV